MARWLSACHVSVSVTSQCSIELTGRIELLFGMKASFDLSYTLCYMEIWVPPKIRVLPSGTLPQTLYFECKNIVTKHRSSKCVINLAQSDKLDCRRSTKLTIPPSSDARPLVYHSDHQALSTARFRRAGLGPNSTTAICCGFVELLRPQQMAVMGLDSDSWFLFNLIMVYYAIRQPQHCYIHRVS